MSIGQQNLTTKFTLQMLQLLLNTSIDHGTNFLALQLWYRNSR